VKTLYLLRHAKSSWDHPGLRDHQRPLAVRGRKAAPAVGRHMAERGWAPELVLCSTATRTRETWDLVQTELETVPVRYEDDIYGASAGELLNLVRRAPADIDHLMVVGHNPSMESLASALAGEGPDQELDRLDRKYPTGALAVLVADIDDWSEAAPGAFALAAFVRPRDL